MKAVTWTRLDGTVVNSQVKKHIGYNDMAAIAIAICADVFKQGVYRPYMKELSLWHYVLLNYTDIVFEDMDEMMANIQRGSLQRRVISEIDPGELAWIREQAEDMIDYERNKGGMDRFGALLVGLLARSTQMDDASSVTESQEQK